MPNCNNQSIPMISDQHVALDPTLVPDASDNPTPNQHSSPWLNSPSDLLQPLTFNFLTSDATSTHTPHAASPKTFNYMPQSPMTPSIPPGSVSWSNTSRLAAASPTTPHWNHSHHFPQAGPHSTISQSPLCPAGNRHGKEVHGMLPFFEEELGQKFCLLCW